MQSCDFVILSVVEGSPGRVPLVYNQVIAINKLRRKGRFREIAHTRNAPLLSLERQQHPRSVGGNFTRLHFVPLGMTLFICGAI